MEESRKEINKRRKKIALILRVIWYCVVVIYFWKCFTDEHLSEGEMMALGFLVFGFLPLVLIGIYCALFEFFLGKKFNKMHSTYKNVFVKECLEKVFDNLEYEPSKGLDKSVLQNTQMMDTGDIYESNDYMKGLYKNIAVEGADVRIQEERHEDESTTYVTTFLGKWLIFEFNKTFKYNLCVVKNGFYGARRSNMKNIGFERVEYESEDFNEKYEVYAQNEEESFYILTPNFMERIQDLCNSINGSIMLCFINNKIHVAINSNSDSFEMNLNEEMNEEKIKAKISEEVTNITKFVDELNLDNDLFKEEQNG